jgi:hypothetical protein
VVAIALALIILVQNLQGEGASPTSSSRRVVTTPSALALPTSAPASPVATAAPPPAASGTVVVPHLAGLSATEARARLMEAGLDYDRVIPTPGTPGLVLSSDPAFGERVPPGTAVKIYIGAESERLQVEETPTGG